MLKFIYDAKDSEGLEFNVLLYIPTQPDDGPMHWKVAPGMFGLMIGKAFVLDGPDEERGSVVCARKDGNTEFTMDKVLASYHRNPHGYFKGVSNKNAGTGRKHPFGGGTVKGEFTWTLLNSF